FKVDLNSDLGESFGNYKIGLDEEVIKYVTSVNVACAWHAGDPLVMEKTIKLAKENEVAVGAHPGFPDLMGFGRRNLSVSPSEMKNYIKYQLGALMAFGKSQGKKIQHVKPHGAMYN
ncbi:LamB/YcsF family protein, partial [Escherichia coli]|nr:LamB/YcsF family protein [Escherichia coli]